MLCRYVKQVLFSDLFEVGKEYNVNWDVTSHGEKLNVSRGEGAEPRYVSMTLAQFHTSFMAIDRRTGKAYHLMPFSGETVSSAQSSIIDPMSWVE